MRLLESHKVAYRVHEFSPEIRSAAELAEALGVPACQVFKTLVVLRERGRPLLVIIPGDRSLDLKALAKALGEKRLSMAAHKDAESLTGLEVGGISALALMHKGFQVCADKRILEFSEVWVSAGTRGINLSLSSQDLVRVTRAALVDAVELQGGDAAS